MAAQVVAAGILAAGSIISSLIGKKKDKYIAPPNVDYSALYREGYSALSKANDVVNADASKIRTETMRDIGNQMARRGIRTSGIHAQYLANTSEKLMRQQSLAKDSLALEGFNAINQSILGNRQLDTQTYLAQLGMAQQNANNQSALQSGIGQSLGNLAAAWLQKNPTNPYDVQLPQSGINSEYSGFNMPSGGSLASSLSSGRTSGTTYNDLQLSGPSSFSLRPTSLRLNSSDIYGRF